MKKTTNLSAAQSVRRVWEINPVTKVIKSKKVYSRKDTSWKKEIGE